MSQVRELSTRATVVLLVTSAVLIPIGLAGLGASLPLSLLCLVLAGALRAIRHRLATLPTVVGYDLGDHGRDLWIGPLLAVAITLVWMGASPGELQALGGLAGFVGMVNHFLRPLYLYGFALARRVAG